MHFGQFLKALREDRALTQAELAASADVSVYTISSGEQSANCGWKRSTSIRVLQALERKLRLSESDASTYLQLANLEAMARSAADSIRRLRDETSAAKAAFASTDHAARIDDPDLVTAFKWMERLFEERGSTVTLAAIEGLAAGWNLDLPNRVRRDEMDRPANMYFYGAWMESEAQPTAPAQRLTVVSPPVQKPGHVEQVFREYEARPPAPLPAAVPSRIPKPKRKAQQ